ncbi:MAG: hypothetical protein Q4P15_08305 [Propionibacteriaceae bacterium]|nr:hypothetical protein [Propionibacteriaceae bacterium]
MTPSVSDRLAVILVSIIGTVLVSAYAAFSLLQILWLNPRAAVPGMTLQQISQDMSAEGESMMTPLVVSVMSAGPIVAIVVLVVVAMRAPWKTPTVVMFYLSVLVLGPFAYFVASFGPGMALADTYWISGEDHSPWARILFAVSGVALLTLIGVTLAVGRTQRAHRPAVV